MNNVFELHHKSKAEIGLTDQTVGADVTVNGEIIDTAGFESLEFLAQAGTVTDGVQTLKINHGDDPALGDATVVSDEETLGSGSILETDSPKKVGYIGKKRYAQLSVVSVGGATGAAKVSAMALLSHAHHQAVAEQ